MEVYLQSLPAGTVVIGAIADEGAFLLTDQARATVRETLGSYFIDLLDYQFSWAIITRKAGCGTHRRRPRTRRDRRSRRIAHFPDELRSATGSI